MARATKEQIEEMKKQKFVLVCKETGRFPKIDTGLVNEKKLTDNLGETYVFDGRDNPQQKMNYYNIIYKGVATFEVFNF